MGWIEATKRGGCDRCKRVIEVGERLWMPRRGTYLCELCNSDMEHEELPIGDNETGVTEELKKLPPEAASGILASMMITLARKIDNGDVADRDIAPLTKEIRQMLVMLRDQFPPEGEDDDTEKARKRRERMLMADREFDD